MRTGSFVRSRSRLRSKYSRSYRDNLASCLAGFFAGSLFSAAQTVFRRDFATALSPASSSRLAFLFFSRRAGPRPTRRARSGTRSDFPRARSRSNRNLPYSGRLDFSLGYALTSLSGSVEHSAYCPRVRR